jgi:hypothetical protein
LSAPANGGDHFQRVSILQVLGRKQAARKYFAIAFQGNALSGQAHFFEQGGNASGIRESMTGTVDV